LGLCLPIVYGGCGGTKNLYDTLEACQRACPATNADVCKQPTDCAVGSPACCGVCDGPELSKHDFIAYNKAYMGKVSTCPGGVACAPCPPPPSAGTLRYFVPNCLDGRCVVEDLRTSDVTACKTAMDCKLRTGNGCCPSCNADQLISVRNDGTFEHLVCGDMPLPCAACLPASDPTVTAVCSPDGHCGVSSLAQ
jgi:hypothetical protein